MSNAIITLAIAATAGALGAIQDLGTTKEAELRKIDLRAGLAQGDIVALLGSSDGTNFDPVLLSPPDNGPPVPLQLSKARASATFNDKSRYYRTQRVQVGTGSTLAAAGLQVGVTPEGSTTTAITLTVDAAKNGLGAIQDLGTSKAPGLRKFDLRAGVAQGDIVTILSSSDGTTFNPVLLLSPNNGPAVPLQLTAARASFTIDDRSRYYQTFRAEVGSGSTLTEVGLEVSSEAADVIHNGGDAFGAPMIIGTTDAFPVTIIAEGKDILTSDGTITALGNPETSVAGSGLELYSGAGGGQWIVDGGGDLTLASSAGFVTIMAGPARSVRLQPRAAGAGNTCPFQFMELAANGSNSVGFKAPDSIASDVTWVLPSVDATIAGQSWRSDAAATISWKGRVNVRASTTNAQSITDGAAAAVITTWTEATDLANAFNATTGVFSCPVGQEGTYIVTAEVEFAAIASIVTGEFTCQIFKNGALVASGVEVCQVAAANCKRNPKVSCAIEMASTDTIDLRVSQNSGSGANALTNVGTRNVLSITGPF